MNGERSFATAMTRPRTTRPAVALASGAVSKARDLRIACRLAPGSSVPGSVREGAAALRRRIGPDAPALHVSDDFDWSGCGVWQRVLHPRPVGCCRVGDPASLAFYEDVRRRRLAKFLFGVGTPPPGLAIPSRVETLAGGVWLVELEERP